MLKASELGTLFVWVEGAFQAQGNIIHESTAKWDKTRIMVNKDKALPEVDIYKQCGYQWPEKLWRPAGSTSQRPCADFWKPDLHPNSMESCQGKSNSTTRSSLLEKAHWGSRVSQWDAKRRSPAALGRSLLYCNISCASKVLSKSIIMTPALASRLPRIPCIISENKKPLDSWFSYLCRHICWG